MASLSTFTDARYAFVPLGATIIIFAGIVAWLLYRAPGRDLPARLLAAAVAVIPRVRRDWGAAMRAELHYVQGFFARWRFAISCSRVALFPPDSGRPPWYVPERFHRLGPVFGALSVALPTLGLPLLYFTSIACRAWMGDSDFSDSGWIPTLLGLCVAISVACIVAGVPLGIAGILREEKIRWLSYMGPLWSASMYAYLQVVQDFANALPAA